MKCYTVAIMTPKGEYKSVYLGGDLAEAKKIYREYKRDKFGDDKEAIAVFFFPKPYSRRVSGTARHLESVEKAKAEAERDRAKGIEKKVIAVAKAEGKAKKDAQKEADKQAQAIKERQQKEKAEQVKQKIADGRLPKPTTKKKSE